MCALVLGGGRRGCCQNKTLFHVFSQKENVCFISDRTCAVHKQTGVEKGRELRDSPVGASPFSGNLSV